nr:hypothetical protein [Tanacetum cinerariifolium]
MYNLTDITNHSRDDDDETLTETLLNIKRSSAKDKGKGIMQETELPNKLKNKEMIQLSVDEELAQKLYAKELATEEARQEQERYNLEKGLELQRQLNQRKENVPKGDQSKEIDWNDPQVLRYHALQNRPFPKAKVRKNMIMYLKNQGGYKQSYFKGMRQIVTMAFLEHFLHMNPSINYRFFLILRESLDFSEESVKKSQGKESAYESGSKFILSFDSSFVEFVQPCFCFSRSVLVLALNWFPLTRVKWLPLIANSFAVLGIVIAEPGVRATTSSIAT